MSQLRTDIALVDGDILTYLAGFGSERVVYSVYLSDEDRESDSPFLHTNSMAEVKEKTADLPEYEIVRRVEIEPLENALGNTKRILSKIAAHTGADTVEVLLSASGSGNFREEIATYRKYKGNRDTVKKPHWYQAIRDYLIKYWNAEVIEGQEADDELGIRQMGYDKSTVICSTDKDLLQIPGLHYNPRTEQEIVQSAEAGDKVFQAQIITGDPTDNIVGCPGAGIKTAKKYFDKDRYFWEWVLDVYNQYLSKKCPKGMEKDGDTLRYMHWNGEDEVVKTVEEFALEQAQLVYIRKNENELWRPNV